MSVCLFTWLLAYLSTCSCVDLFDRVFVCLFVCSIVRPCEFEFVCSFVCGCVGSLVGLYVCLFDPCKLNPKRMGASQNFSAKEGGIPNLFGTCAQKVGW